MRAMTRYDHADDALELIAMNTPDPIAYVEGRLQTIVVEQGKLHEQLKALVKERDAMRAALLDLEFIFEGQEDIKDGPEGQQLPNDAMKAMTIIRGALGT